MRTSDRRTRAIVAALAASLTLMTVIGPAAAAAPQQVRIVSPITFGNGEPNFGTFTTSGSATESGLICASGSVLDTGYVFGGYQSGRKVQILVRKLFTCDDGSGTIFVKIQVHVDFTVGETFTWTVQGGTGAYTDLRGSGQGSTVDNPPTGNINTYVGLLVN